MSEESISWDSSVTTAVITPKEEYLAQAEVNGRYTYLGTYDTSEEASAAVETFHAEHGRSEAAGLSA